MTHHDRVGRNLPSGMHNVDAGTCRSAHGSSVSVPVEWARATPSGESARRRPKASGDPDDALLHVLHRTVEVTPALIRREESPDEELDAVFIASHDLEAVARGGDGVEQRP